MRFQTYMIFYWYGVLKLEEILKLCETTFGTSIDAYKKLELCLGNIDSFGRVDEYCKSSNGDIVTITDVSITDFSNALEYPSQ